MSEFEMEIEEVPTVGPERILIYGAGGVGKTVWASQAPRPFFIDLEQGSTRIPFVGRPKNPIKDWETIVAAVGWLRNAKHPYQTVVIDTLDRAEWYCWKDICEKDGVKRIEEACKGYGKGYTAAYENFRGLFSQLEGLLEHRAMNVVIVAHEKVDKVANPSGEGYTRYAFKVNEKVGMLMYEACDHVLHATRNIVITDQFDDGKQRAIGGEQRLLRTAGRPSFLAKNRAGVPDPIPLSWHEWVCHLAAGGFPRMLRDTLRDNARRIGDAEIIKKTDAELSNNVDVRRLAALNKRLATILEAKNQRVSLEEETKEEPKGDEKKAEPAPAN